MTTVQVNFATRIRLIQLVGKHRFVGIPMMREGSRLLEILLFSEQHAKAVDLDIDVPADRIQWDRQKVEELKPVYSLDLDTPHARTLRHVLECAELNVMQDRPLMKLYDDLGGA